MADTTEDIFGHRSLRKIQYTFHLSNHWTNLIQTVHILSLVIYLLCEYSIYQKLLLPIFFFQCLVFEFCWTVINISKTAGATNVAGTAYPPGAHHRIILRLVLLNLQLSQQSFVNHCSSIFPSSFGLFIACPAATYGFWLPLFNVRENRRTDQEWTIQRHWQHWTHNWHSTKTNKALG